MLLLILNKVYTTGGLGGIQIHRMLLLILTYIKLPSTSISIQIHRMLLLIVLGSIISKSLSNNSNTSYVAINPDENLLFIQI